MKTDPMEALRDGFCEALETLAFMFAEPVDKGELPTEHAEFIQVKMGFSGQLDGTIVLLVPAVMPIHIAANVLGMEPDDEFVVERGIDAVKEVLNVTCGRFLTLYAGESPVFDLSVPATSQCDAQSWQDMLKAPNTLAFLVDDVPVLLALAMKGDPA